jgi:hypothetical protein
VLSVESIWQDTRYAFRGMRWTLTWTLLRERMGRRRRAAAGSVAIMMVRRRRS